MKRTLIDLIPTYITKLRPYVPGRPVEEIERELKIKAIKLASNENPLGPSPKAVEAITQFLPKANRYPDGSGYYLREKLAARLGVSMDEIILGAGSTELIELVARTFVAREDEVLTAEGSFAMYYIAAQEVGAQLVRVPLKNHAYDLEAMSRRVGERTKVIYIANPNNPTGTMFTATEFNRFLERVPEHAVVVLDEAYFDYVQHPDYSRSIQHVKEGRNLLVLRTFSKVHGLAGLRIGHGIGRRELINYLNRIRSPFNTSAIAQAAALAALDDEEHIKRSVESNNRGLKFLAERFRQMGVEFVPSVANFILVDVGCDGDEFFERLKREGVIVRPMAFMGFPTAIRVTVGTQEENERFLKAFEQVRSTFV
jgi:histidinol-phosphate aminotransferase